MGEIGCKPEQFLERMPEKNPSVWREAVGAVLLDVDDAAHDVVRAVRAVDSDL